MKKFVSGILICFVVAIMGIHQANYSNINSNNSNNKKYVVRNKCKYKYDCGFTQNTNYFYMRKKHRRGGDFIPFSYNY